MAAMDLLGRRWALRILWELGRQPRGARELLSQCEGLSSSVLYDRLRELADVGLVVRQDTSGYALSATGRQLADAIAPLDAWAEAWAAQLARGS